MFTLLFIFKSHMEAYNELPCHQTVDGYIDGHFRVHTHTNTQAETDQYSPRAVLSTGSNPHNHQ